MKTSLNLSIGISASDTLKPINSPNLGSAKVSTHPLLPDTLQLPLSREYLNGDLGSTVVTHNDINNSMDQVIHQLDIPFRVCPL